MLCLYNCCDMANIFMESVFYAVLCIVLQKAVADECVNHRELSSEHRSSSFYSPFSSWSLMCDDFGPGWYRFMDDAGELMSTKCIPKFHCSSYGPGWLNGDHPKPQDGRVTRTVCFQIDGDCCRESVEIQVRNCGEFMVYHLVPVPKCPLRYCGEEVKNFSTGHTVPDPCEHYSVFSEADRARSFYDPYLSLTDVDLTPGWYRFMNQTGDHMAKGCINLFHCGTHAPGWLRGNHPTEQEGAVLREVCFKWMDDCCFYKQQILVRNCKNFYVYELPGTEYRYLRYCGNAH